MWNAAVSLKEPLVFSLLLKVPKGNRTPRPPRGREGKGLRPTRDKARTEAAEWPAVRNVRWGGVGRRGKLASPSRQGSRESRW